MQDHEIRGALVARCVVCRGDIYQNESYEMWEGGFYCERHNLTLLRQRARLYGRLVHPVEPNPECS